MKKLIAIDCGKMYMKARCNDKVVIYENRYSEKHYIDNKKTNWNVVYENNNYFIGEHAEDGDWREGKASEFHIVSALTCITRFLNSEEINDDIVIIYGDSVDLFFDIKNKQDIINAFEGKHKINISGEEFIFTITKVHVLPEGYGCIFSN